MRNEKPSAQEDYEEAQAERREARQQGADNSSGGPSPNDPLQLIEPPKIHCDKCGAVNAADATKCSGCGANLGTQPPPPKVGYMLGRTKLACNVGNVLLALKQEPTIMNAFAFDEMARTEILMRPLFLTEPEFRPRPVTDADVIKLQSWLQWRLEFKRLGKNTTHEAVHVNALKHSFHPVRDYLDRVASEWDGQPRVSTWLSVYAGAPLIVGENKKSTGYIEQVGKMFLVGMVARIYRPGCKFDYMLILEGEQGREKSKLCEALVGEEYFSDQLPDISHKDASMHLRGKWLIEMAEMHAYTRAEISKYKEFMTRRVERYRPVWGRKDVFEPRTCAFIGTTNKVRYLRDETGNRRSWPVVTERIDIAALKRDRDQLWGEAVRLFRNDEQWWPNYEFEHKHIRPQQDARFEPDPWEPLIKKELDRLVDQALKAQPSYIPETTILKIAVKVLGYTTKKTVAQGELATPISRLDPKVGQRITAVLHHLGWVPKHSERGRWWEPGPNAT